MSWASVKVKDAVRKAAVTKANQILASEIQTTGRFPVVDQGQSFVAGYSDDASRVVEEGLPVVVFGDHTRALKYVDFPFIVGADGTKVLKPKEDLYDPKFFYYALVHLGIPSRGYNRHYTILKEAEIARPDLEVQESIAAVLSRADDAVVVARRRVELVQELKQAALSQIFTHGRNEEQTRETEAGRVPESWEVATIGEIAHMSSGGTPSRSRADYWDGGTIPWVKTGEVDNCVITETEECITPDGLAGSSAKLFPAGTLLMAMYGQGVTRGKVGLLGIDATTNQACVAIFPDGAVGSEFLYYFLQSRYAALRSHGHGANQKNLSAEIIRGLSVAFPEAEEDQEAIVNAMNAIDERLAIARRQLDQAVEMFDALLKGVLSESGEQLVGTWSKGHTKAREYLHA